MTKQTIITVQESKALLRALELEAGANFHNSRELFTKGILALYQIREERLWLYAEDENGIMFGDYNKPGFGTYLHHFCQSHGISRSSAYAHISTVESWKALGRPEEQLETIGLDVAAPVKRLAPVDGRTGEIRMPTQEVLDTLPPGDSPMDRVRAKVAEVFDLPEIPLTPTDVRKSFTVDIGHTEYTWFIDSDGAICLDYEIGGDMWTGVVVSAATLDGMPDEIARFVRGKYGLN